jgi:Trk-type K+ transport system membrane component
LVNWLGPIFIGLIIVGAVLLHLSLSSLGGEQLSGPRSIFQAVNAVTLTGFPVPLGVDQYAPFGQIVMFILTVTGSTLILFAGGLAVARIARLTYSPAQLLTGAIIAQAAAILIGAEMLWDGDRTFYQAAFQSACAFGNSGLSIGKLPGSLDWQTHAVLMPWAFLGGLGLPVLMDVVRTFIFRRPLSDYCRNTLVLAGLGYLAGFALLVLIQLADPNFTGWSDPEAWRQLLANSSILSIDSRTAGLPLVSLDVAGRMAQWVVVILMGVGACSGGTAGGLKLGTVARLWRGTRNVLGERDPGRATGVAAVWLCVYVLMVFATLLLLLRANPQLPGDQLLFDSVSAISNVGLSRHEITGVPATYYCLSAAMIMGRLMPIFILWWMAETTPRATSPVG